MSKPPGLVNIVADPELVSESAAGIITQVANESVKDRGSFVWMLSGGSTPVATYEKLAEEPYVSKFPWKQTFFYWGDERCVPPDDPDSNYGMAYAAVLSKVEADSSRIFRIQGELEDHETEARDYEGKLPGRIDLMLLGIGEDGHIASLFPGSDAVHERRRKVMVVTGPKPPNPRITVTPPVIRSASLKLLLATGKGKSGSIYEALYGEEAAVNVPAQLARGGMFILDEDAGLKLPRDAGTSPDR